MDHKNIVKTKDSFIDQGGSEMVMIFQFCEYGDLDQQYQMQKEIGEPFQEDFIQNCVI
jgi:serine/threonine protein kinase